MMQCPRDRTILLTYSHAAEFHSCDACHGLWFSKEQLRLCVQQGGLFPSSHPSIANLKDRKLSSKHQNCPECGNTRLTAKRIEGIEVDLCPRCHGIWLDAGELEAILQWHRKRAPAMAGTKHSRAADVADVLFEGVVNADLIGGLTEAIGETFSKTPEIAGEAAAAVVEFLGEVFSGLFS